MSLKEPLTLFNQDDFCAEEDCRANYFEFEDWDTPEKISTLLWRNAPLVGEFGFSEEFKKDLHNSAKNIFQKLLKSHKAQLSLMDEKILTLEAIVLTQEMDLQNDESQLWPYLFSSLGYEEDKSGQTSYQQLYKRCREMLQDTVSEHGRLFADFGEGKKYYNTLNIHALTPAWSFEHLFNILYSFYSKNLEFQYEPHDHSFELLVRNIAKRWVGQSEKESDLKLRSDALASGLKMLFIHRPNYMAAVCDALTERMDAVLKNGIDQLDCQSKWDLMLKAWYNHKTAVEQNHMLDQRKKASKEHVVTRKEEINPLYNLSGEEVFITVPRIRLPEITEKPVAQLLQNGKLIKSINLSVFGNDLCLTTREFEMTISCNPEIDWYAPMNFAVRIICGENEVYHSGTSLFRKYLLFSEHGHEIRNLKHKYATIFVLANSQANVDISDTNFDYSQLDSGGQLLRVGMSTLDHLLIDQVDVLQQGKNRTDVFYYMSEIKEDRAYIESENHKYEIYHQAPEITIELPHNDSSQNYFLLINSQKHGLYEYGDHTSTIKVQAPQTPHYFHSIELRRFSDNKTVFSFLYVVLPQFSYEFEKELYSNRYCEGSVKVRCMGNSRTMKFEIAEDQKEIEFELWKNAICHLRIPKLNALLSGRNAFSLTDFTWYDDFELEDFLRIEVPSGCKASLVLGNGMVSSQGQHYELGNYLHSKSDWRTSELPLGIIVRKNGEIICEEFLTSVIFQEKFIETPLRAYNVTTDEGVRHVIDWDPRGVFIGPSDSQFVLWLDTDCETQWHYAESLKKKNVEKNFPCKDGLYHYRIVLNGKQKFFTKTPDRDIYDGEILIGDPNISRFYGTEVRLRKVCFWNCFEDKQEIAPIRNGDAILVDIEYVGMSVPDTKEICYPEYSATLCFANPFGGYQKFCSYEFSSDREWTNPVSFWIVDDTNMIIQARNGGPLLVNTRRTKSICTVRVVDSYSNLPKEYQYKYINDADYFEFEVIPVE